MRYNFIVHKTIMLFFTWNSIWYTRGEQWTHTSNYYTRFRSMYVATIARHKNATMLLTCYLRWTPSLARCRVSRQWHVVSICRFRPHCKTQCGKWWRRSFCVSPTWHKYAVAAHVRLFTTIIHSPSLALQLKVTITFSLILHIIDWVLYCVEVRTSQQ